MLQNRLAVLSELNKVLLTPQNRALFVFGFCHTKFEIKKQGEYTMYETYERVGDKLKKEAKGVNLRLFLMDEYPDKIQVDEKNQQYHLANDPQTLIGVDGFMNFNNRHRGDQIQFLEDFCGMSFGTAVRELSNYAKSNPDKLLSPEEKGDDVRRFLPPARTFQKFKCVWSYLVLVRKIPAKLVEELFKEQVLYQANNYNNCVFISKVCEFAEIHGSSSDVAFKQLAKGCESDGYWITGDIDAENCYICKSAIDAISLKALHRKYCPEKENSVYISICGCNSDAVKRIIKKGYKNIVLAFPDSTDAENLRYDHSLKYISPGTDIVDGKTLADWNDILVHCKDEQKIKEKIEDIMYDELPF